MRWVRKTANVPNKMPQGVQPKAKAMLHAIWMAETKVQANKAFDLFIATFQAKCPKAAQCLAKDRALRLSGATATEEVAESSRRQAASELAQVRLAGQAISPAATPDHGHLVLTAGDSAREEPCA